MKATYPMSQRLLEYGAIGLFAALSAFSLARFFAATEWMGIPLLLVALPLGWAASDLLSGLLHWIFDTKGSEKTPLIGRAFIRPFREHHVDPEAMARHDFVETHGASCLAALPVLAATSLMPLGAAASPFAQVFLLSTALGALATNQCHKWAHMDEADVPAPARWAERRGLILPRRHHALHHAPPFDSHYCMSNGWVNKPLDLLLRAWR
jgi:hypothetical protein